MVVEGETRSGTAKASIDAESSSRLRGLLRGNETGMETWQYYLLLLGRRHFHMVLMQGTLPRHLSLLSRRGDVLRFLDQVVGEGELRAGGVVRRGAHGQSSTGG